MNYWVKFLGDAPNLDEVATTVQAKTYRLLRQCLEAHRQVTVGEILDGLELKDPRPLYSRLDHLQEKGFLKWGKSPAMAT